MISKGEHLEYISQKGLFTIDCDLKIFTKKEIEILEKWGHWFIALTSGELKPFTEMQERFIKVMNGELKPSAAEETAWFKYLGRKSVERKFGDRLRVQYEAEHDSFYSREDKKLMNKITYSTISRIHNRGLSEK